jgi:succinate dehydrogenase / fumarate reductase, cytochrome b subunit
MGPLLWLKRMLTSSIGLKVMMALSGAALLGFVVAHMAGNLLSFAGQETFNEYAKGLEDLGGILWIMRGGLLGAFVVHVAVAFKLFSSNKNARPVRYVVHSSVQSTATARTMIWSGLAIFAFIVFHLLHFTFGVIDIGNSYAGPLAETANPETVRDVYTMFVAGFSNIGVTATYVIAMVLLGGHLSHGIASLFQSLGLRAPKFRPLITKAGHGLAAILVLGNISMPVAVLLGLISTGG